MKFDVLYPNQPTEVNQNSIDFEGSELFKYGELQPCWNCGKLTNWIDINFQAHLCSEECEREKWKEYQDAFKMEIG